MSRLPAALTILAMLVHSLAGCCTHHAHAATASFASASPVASMSTCGCCHHAGDPAGDHAADHESEQSPSGEQCPTGDQCNEGRCVFVGSAAVVLPVLALCGPACWIAPDAVGDSGFCSHARFDADVGLRPPATLIELHQILLI